MGDRVLQSTVNPINPNAPASSDPEINRVISIVNTVETKNNFLDQLNPDSNVSLPFGIIKQIGAVRYVIAIDSLHFKPEGAFFSAYAALDFPGTLTKLAFRASNIKFNPQGVIAGNQAKLFLASNHTISINRNVTLKLLGNGQNWVEWDCNGFKAINLQGNFVFKKGILLPDETQTSENEVTASFQIYTKNLHEFVTTVNVTPFKINGLDDWGFKVTNAVVDMSELSNASTMVFPEGYNNPNIPKTEMWTGFALQSLLVKLPTEIAKTGKKTEVLAKNILIDNMGITGLFQVNNVFKSDEGNLGGWDFSIDELGAGFICNQLTSGHLKGTVNIPIVDSSQALQYIADVNYNPISKNVNYNFVIKPESNLRFKVFSATVNLNSNSYISVAKTNGIFKPVANLNGYISFDNSKFHSNGGALAFQNLTIISEAPYITNGVFTLHNINGSQSRSGNYPVSVDDIIFGINQGAPVLGFNVKLNLTEMTYNTLTIGTNILLKGKIETREQYYGGENRQPGVTITKQRWSFDKAIINGASVNIETSPFTLKGNILFNDNHPTYGSGFFGTLDLSIKKILEEPVGINVGFGSKENYKFFFLDAKIPARYIIPGTPIGLSQIIGGFYYHMKPNKSTETEMITLNQSFSSVSGNALTYVPTPTISLGIKMGATGEFIFNEAVCNGDFLLDINFTNSGGLGLINLAGNLYSMAKIANKFNAPIKGRLVMTFDPQTKTFDGLAQINMSLLQVISGSGYLKAHFDPSIWYVCAGKPSAPNNIKFLNVAEAPSYFMTGNSIESALPPPGSLPNTSERNLALLQNGSGFCAGAKVHSSFNRTFGWSFFNVSADFNFDLGFDLMMRDYGERATCSTTNEKIGLNGRLAQGDVYLFSNLNVWINGTLKILPNCPNTWSTHAFCGDGHCCCVSVTLPCIFNEDFSFPVFESSFFARVSAKIPKPLYFSGTVSCPYNIFDKIRGDIGINFSYGTNCDPVPN